MIVYVDLVFLFNFILNMIFLVVIEIIYKTKINFIRITLGGVIGGLIVIISYFDIVLYNLFKICGGILIGMVGFAKSDTKTNLIKYSSFYTLNLASVGLSEAFGINTHILLIFSLTAIIVIYFVESNKNLIIFSNKLKYNIIVNFNKTSLNLKGYLDTGNFSEANNTPIIYVSDKYLKDDILDERFTLVPVQTVGSTSFLKAYKPSSCFLVRGKKLTKVDVLVVFSNIHEYECLLNVKVLI